MRERRSHVNLVRSSRQLAELDPGAEARERAGGLLIAGSDPHPLISNSAFRLDDGDDAGELVAAAMDFFARRGRRFSLWARQGLAADDDLLSAAVAAGMEPAYSMPAMVLGERPEPPRLPAGAELRRVDSAADAREFWRIARASYASLGFPPETFSYTRDEGMLAANLVAFLALLEGRPAAIAMAIVSDGVAGIYWVGSLDEARGRGLGRAVTAAATCAGFDLGADLASLQASPMGRPIYEAMGYETIYDYQLLLSPAA